MPSAYITANPANGNVGRPQPQTTQEASGGPPIRYMRSAQRPGYTYVSSSPFGVNITNTVPSAPGYLRAFNLLTVVPGNSGTGGVLAADAPYNFWNFIQLKDPWGTPLLTGDGYSLLYLLRKYAGQSEGLWNASNPANLPSYSSTAASGAFTFRTELPLEGTKGYGVLSIGDASLLPTLQLTSAASTAVYSTAPSTLPASLTATVDEDYYMVDPNNAVEPYGNGSTFQTQVTQANQSIAQSSSTRVQLPRTAGYLTSAIFVLRDTTNTREDGWNSSGRIRMYIDGVPRFDELFNQAIDRMYEFNQIARDTGVIAYSFKDSLNQVNLGLLDSLESAMQTQPGTLIEMEMTPWGSGGTGNYNLYAIMTQLVPFGQPAQGLPEV